MENKDQYEYKEYPTLRISVTENKDYSGGNSVKYKVITSSFDELNKLLTSHNYSLIHWKEDDNDQSEYNRYRKGNNFESASGIMLDFDNTITLDEITTRLSRYNYTYFLITSKNHGVKGNRFHVLIPFDREIKSSEKYRKIIKYIRKIYFPESDPAVGDLARFFYGSLDNAIVKVNNKGKPLNTGKILSVTDWEINPDHMIRLSDDQEILIKDIREKLPCYCPFPDHDDQNPSAFVNIQNGRHYVHCSSCNWTWWETDITPDWENICKQYWSYGAEVWDFGMLDGEFFYEKIGEKKFYILTGSYSDRSEKEAAYNYLVTNKHIRHITRIDYLGDVNIHESYYHVDLTKGIIEVHCAAIPEDIQDNAFIEDYLEDRFGKYKDFTKEWWAMYCYTNYVKLPTIILKGNRGIGKSVFAEVTAEIFRPLSFSWNGSEENFTYEVEKKLLLVEENENSAQHQYKTLKKYSGQKYATVKKKFKDPYTVLNNVNIILLANDSIPLFVTRDEEPKNELNNQFFVYEVPPISGPLDVNIQEKLEKRLGHYIRTELKDVYNNLNRNGCRYGIKVPITEEEKGLFRDSVSNLESDADQYIERLVISYSKNQQGIYSDFINQGYVPTQFFRDYDISKTHINSLIKNLKRRGYITGESERIQINGKREYCYKMTKKLIEEINTSKFEDKSGCCAPKVAVDK